MSSESRGAETSDSLRPKSPDADRPSRVILTDNDLGSMSPAEFASKWRLQDVYITALEQRLSQQEGRYSSSVFNIDFCHKNTRTV